MGTAEYLTAERSQMNDFGVWTKMTPQPGSARMVVRSFVFISDGRTKKEKGGKKKKRERPYGRAGAGERAGRTDVLHCGR